MAVRAASAGQPAYQSYHTQQQPSGQWAQHHSGTARYGTDPQGWTVPWEGHVSHHSFMMRVAEEEVTTAHQPTNHLAERRRGSLVPTPAAPRLREALQRQSPHTRQRGVLQQRVTTSIGDLAAWANCNFTLRRIERIVEVTECAQEPVGKATRWYLDYQSHRTTDLGPKARRTRLEDLMEENRSRAACMLTWHQKWTVLAWEKKRNQQSNPSTSPACWRNDAGLGSVMY